MLPILMYHGLHGGPDDAGFHDPVYSVRPHDFEQQLHWLAHHGYRSVLLRDIGTRIPVKCVVIAFDDGDISNLTVALPALMRRGMRAEFCITTDFIGRRGSLNEEDVRTLADAGMGVQSHGCTHRYLADLDEEELDFELRLSRQRLQAITGTQVTAIALPGGRGGERERKAALRAGYWHFLNSAPGVNAHWKPGEYLQRLPITGDLTLEKFADLVQWRGLAPRILRARYEALAQAKQMLGNRAYERWRERVVLR
jgi:peptidoglycan/xylan/chitin deacetylase (PgdA/CDA1 family)